LPSRLVIGLMSGTSMDGVDAALVSISGYGTETSVETLAFDTFGYPPEIRGRLGNVSRADVIDLCELNVLVGEVFADAAKSILTKGQTSLDRVDLIGSHGQTVCHVPRRVGRHGSTLQIGEPAVIAERTGVTTVANFRARDVAAGGDGAPLVPYVDYVLFAQEGRVRVAHNLGGISNLTVVAERREDVFGFDTGPGNMPIDCAARIMTDGRMEKDDDGKLARKGNVDDRLLALLLEHPFLNLDPPKSTGAEEFGADYVADIIKRNSGLSVEDMLATITRFVAESILKGYKEFVLPRHEVDEIIFSGGGTRNGTLMGMLQELLSPIPITTSDTYGIPSDAKEAVAFAVLANETVCGNPGNIPAATGARHETVLGTIVPGRTMGTLFSPPSGRGLG